MHNLRILFVGTTSGSSYTSLAAFIAAGAQVCGVATPGQQPGAPAVSFLKPAAEHSPIPLVQPVTQRTIVSLAWERNIPVLALGRARGSSVAQALAVLQPDVACVTCFPWRVAPALLAIPPLGWLNLHP